MKKRGSYQKDTYNLNKSTKFCKNCLTEKLFCEFNKNSMGKLGLQSFCKTCSGIRYFKYSELNKDKIRKKNQNYLIRSRKQINEYQNNYRKRRKIYDLSYKIACNLRTRIWHFVNGKTKKGSAVRDLGCSVDFLKQHLESKFTHGMSWNNYGKWHIDHIRPLSSFDLTNRQDFLFACHYTNLQPLWAADNLRKGDSFPLGTGIQTAPLQIV